MFTFLKTLPLMDKRKTKRILIYRLGSLGDTIVTFPAFHLIARAFPEAERHVLTNFPIGDKAAPLSAILDGSGLVHGYMSYPLGLRDLGQLNSLRNRIKQSNPDILIYLAEPRGRAKAIRDVLFFRSCGIKKMIGVPNTRRLQENQWLANRQCFEHEAERLARCLTSLGDVRLDDPESWDLHLTVRERERAMRAVRSFEPYFRFVACSIGTKIDVNNWGEENWRNFIGQLYRKHKDYGLVLIGSKDEFDYSERTSRSWLGPKLNLCGMLTPRESAAVLKIATMFLGHDSGPMHLAASVGTPCVAIFSARNKPGVWFPYGAGHKVIYHKTGCFGCGLDICKDNEKRCITSIEVKEVMEAVDKILHHVNS